MSATSRHAAITRTWKRARSRGPVRQVTALLTVAAASAAVVIAVAVAPASPRAAVVSRPAAAPPVRSGATSMLAVRGNVGGWPGLPALGLPAKAAVAPPPASVEPAPLELAALQLTARDRSLCPAAATACVDLVRHITWLQSGGTVSFGPVQMEPGPPGTPHATPRGTFQVSWKAGPHFISTSYGTPMPWAVFFAPGGIAFHGGSLTRPSHGCVHLTVANARYYNAHLPIGAEVVVF
jgi:L,D-transpeptidase catalytic domain